MIAIPPIDCTAPGVLISTNAVDWLAYNAATTYAAYVETTGYTTTTACSFAGRNWTSVQAGNVGKTPGSEPLWWVDAGPVNSLALFDTSVQTATTRTGGLEFVLAPGRFTAIGFLALLGQSITITIRDGATVIYTETRTLASTDGTYFGFCLGDLEQTRETTFYGLPSTPTAQITVSIAGAGVTSCGLCVVGKQFEIGKAEYGFSTPIEDRGRHYLDSLGNPVNVERGYSRSVSGTVITPRGDFNRLNAFLADHVGIPMLWVAAPGQADLVSASTFGRYTRSVPVISNFTHISTALEIAAYR